MNEIGNVAKTCEDTAITMITLITVITMITAITVITMITMITKITKITMIKKITVIPMMCCQVQLTNLLIPFSQAEVTGYPTIRIYNRAEDFLVGEN